MLRMKWSYVHIAAIATISLLFSLAASADTSAEAKKICMDYLLNHAGDKGREQACIDAMELAAAASPRESESESASRPPTQVFPVRKTAVVTESHEGDRDRILMKLRSGESVEVLVEFNVSEARTEIHDRALVDGLRSLSSNLLEEKQAAYTAVKQRGLAQLSGIEVLRNYDNLATTFVRVSDEEALNALVSRSEVIAVHENRARRRLLAQSLPLIQQPAAAALGQGGAGTTIAVLDTGVDYTIAPFNCTSPGVPAGCRVVATLEAAPDDSSLDDDGHGTNVSAVAASTAGDADIVVADVFNGASAFDADILTAITWAIANQATYNIVSMNLSLGDTTVNVSTCPTDGLATSLADALAAGIQPVIASGNTAYFNSSFDDGIASPACVPAAVSVGAVYDANVGGISWGSAPFNCTDTSSAADQIPCFSQTAPILSLLGPGALVTAGGSTQGGTSQAAPHVAGAWAVVRAAAPPNATKILEVMQDTGDSIVDSRPTGTRTTPRINLLPEPGLGTLLGAGVMGLVVHSNRRRARNSRA